MTYLDQARAGDWGHKKRESGCCVLCGSYCGHAQDDDSLRRIAIFALERAIAEIEELAKERCEGCKRGDNLNRDRSQHTSVGPMRMMVPCLAQPEQRRLAALHEEREGLKDKDGASHS